MQILKENFEGLSEYLGLKFVEEKPKSFEFVSEKVLMVGALVTVVIALRADGQFMYSIHNMYEQKPVRIRGETIHKDMRAEKVRKDITQYFERNIHSVVRGGDNV